MTPAGCSTVQFSSDTVYQELALAPTSYGLSITRLPPTEVADGKWGVPGLPTISVLLGYTPEIPTTSPSGSVICQSGSQGAGEPCACWIAPAQSLSRVQSFCDPLDCSPQTPLHGTSQARALGWLPLSSPGDPPDPGTAPTSSASAGRFFTLSTREAPYQVTSSF